MSKKRINPATTRNPYNRLFGFVTVAGLIGVTANSILPYRGLLTEEMESTPDLPSGIYRQVGNPLLSVDGNTSLYHGILICFNSESGFGAYGAQFYFNGDGTSVYSRGIEYGGVSGGWKKL